MNMWQPIETAPKDRFLLLCGPSGYIIIPWVFVTGCMYSDYHVGRWVDHANDDLSDWGFEPTHWMPLPEAPDAQTQPAPSVPREAIEKILTQLMDLAVSNGANSISMPDEYVEVAAWLCGIPAQPAPSVPDGWKEAAIAWEVCASIHREYGKGKDPFFNTRQGDFVKHANDARAMLEAAPEAKP